MDRDKILNESGGDILASLVRTFWDMITAKPDTLLRVSCDEDRKAIVINMWVAKEAPLGAFLGAKTANINAVLRLLRVQQYKPHNRYLYLKIYKESQDGTQFMQPQVFVDKSVFLKDH